MALQPNARKLSLKRYCFGYEEYFYIYINKVNINSYMYLPQLKKHMLDIIIFTCLILHVKM